MLRRLRWHQQNNNLLPNGGIGVNGVNGIGGNGGKFVGYGMGIDQMNPLTGLGHTFNYHHQADLQRVVTVTRDPLAIAERGKVGIPSSHSECSSNDSIEASVDSHTGILSAGEREPSRGMSI